jgi:hypothetical protein
MERCAAVGVLVATLAMGFASFPAFALDCPKGMQNRQRCLDMESQQLAQDVRSLDQCMARMVVELKSGKGPRYEAVKKSCEEYFARTQVDSATADSDKPDAPWVKDPEAFGIDK